MLTLITKTINKNIVALLIYTAISASFVWMYVAFYPSMAREGEKLKEAFKAYPQEIFQAFDIEVETFVSSLEGFIAGEHFSIIWPAVLTVLIVAYASSAIAGEIEKGTIEFLLSQPISRLKIFLAKYLSGLLIIISFILLSNFSVVPFAIFHNVNYQLQNYLTISVIGFLFAFAIFGTCMMISSFTSSKGIPAMITGSLLIIMYAINIFSAFQESLSKLKYASFFHYYDYKEAIVNNQIDTVNIVIFLLVGVITALIGAVIFIKRDIATT